MEWKEVCGFYVYPADMDSCINTFVEYFKERKHFGQGDWQGPGWYVCSDAFNCPNNKRLEGVTTLEEAQAVAAMMHHMG
jgi:hypothetical protein